MQIPDTQSQAETTGGNPTLTCQTSQPVVNVTHVSRPLDFTGIIEMMAIVAAVIVILILAIWRYSVVTNSNYRTRRQRAFEHEQKMAELEVQKQRAIAGIDPFQVDDKPKARR
jgi:Na+-transporting methylmalonyl-CoA/oxaloacetate decarboxylase gamma subunit